MKKFNFDIEIDNSKQVMGGYLLTLHNKTVKQTYAEMEKLGREFLRNNPSIDNVSYSAWEEGVEDIGDGESIFVTLRRNGRKINVLTY